MAPVHTHYDNLKVARSAPPEVIRAAYKALSQRFHPDRNPGITEAARIMAIINTSYDVLSDPEKRRQHDQWIMEVEAADQVKIQTGQATQATTQYSSAPDVLPRLVGLLPYALGIGALIGVIWMIGSAIDFFGGKSSPPPGPKPYQTGPGPVRPVYVRPITAPNGQPWPTYAGYVTGYQRLHTDGLSTVMVDNTRNDSDVFVKLVSLDGARAYPVRQFYIPAFGSFSLKTVTAGTYDIRYRDLSNGGLSRSEVFNLEEIQTYDGVQYSNITMTLYKVRNGNMQTYGLSESEF